MKSDTTAKIHELSGPQGKEAVITPGTGTQTVVFNLTNLPTGKDGRFLYYVKDIIVAVDVVIDQPAMSGAIIDSQLLWRAVSSLYAQCPVLGTTHQHNNNRGTVVGLLCNRISMGYADFNHAPDVPAADGDYTRTLYFRLPFAQGWAADPMEFAPWAGFLEGGTVEVKIPASTVFANVSTDSVYQSANVRAWLNLAPKSEAVIHAPCHYREHTGIPASQSRHTITDVGASDGLQGIDQSKGVGIAALMYEMGPTAYALGSGWATADEITSIDLPWRDQVRIDAVDALFADLILRMGPRQKSPSNDSTGATAFDDASGFPYTDGNMLTARLNDDNALIFPLVMPAEDTKTSHVQTVAGAKDINFTTSGTLDAPVLYGCYLPVFDDSFIHTQLIPRITPGLAGQAQLRAKTLNKQKGGIAGVGKLAYAARKIAG